MLESDAAALQIGRLENASSDNQQQQQQQVAHAAAAAHVEASLSFSARPGLYDSRGRLMLKALTLPELEEWCESIGRRWTVRMSYVPPTVHGGIVRDTPMVKG